MHRRVAAVLLGGCVLTAIFGAPLAAGADSKPALTAEATPAANLGDQVVRVDWQHFHPTTPTGLYGVVIMECSAHPTSVLADCNTAETFPLSLTGNQASAVTESDGTGSAFIDVESTARLPELACSSTHPCSLLVYEAPPQGFDPNRLPPDRVLVPLQFRKNAADCPPVTHFDVKVEAEASAAAAFYQWAADVCTGTGSFTVDVTNTSSNAARQQFFGGNVDIGVSSLPPAPGEAPPGFPDYSVTPVDLTGVVLAYNIVDPVTRQRITDLTLTPRLVARLVSDSNILSFFDDPEFKKLNPHHHFPSTASDPGLRAEENADTWIVTNWLNSDPDARAFLNGHDKYHVAVNPAWRDIAYPTDVFEARNPAGSYLPRTGEDGVGQRLFYNTKPAESVSSGNTGVVGFIGVLDLPTARRYDLPVARLTTGVGEPSVAPTVASIQAGYRAMTVTRQGFHVEPGTVSDPDAYPLTKVDHALTLDSVSDSLTRARLKYLLAYAAGPGQKTLPPGFVDFPGPEVPTTTTTTSTTSTTSTTTTTTVPGESSLSQTPFSSSSSSASGGPTTPAPSVKVARTPTRRVTTPRVATPRLTLISQSDRLALPIVLVLAMLAAAYLLVDAGRRRGPALITGVRRWRSSGAARRGVTS